VEPVENFPLALTPCPTVAVNTEHNDVGPRRTQDIDCARPPVHTPHAFCERVPHADVKNSWTLLVHMEKGQKYILQCPHCGANASRKQNGEVVFMKGLQGIVAHYGNKHSTTPNLCARIVEMACKMNAKQIRAYARGKKTSSGQFHRIHNACLVRNNTKTVDTDIAVDAWIYRGGRQQTGASDEAEDPHVESVMEAGSPTPTTCVSR
jgi:hypothetical protein